MSIEMQTAFERDMAVINENESYEYVDNEDSMVPDEPIIEPPIEKPVQEQEPADNAVDQFFNQ